MTSERKINANRKNAQASTGPKSYVGRARSARNALRHGLSLPVALNPAWSKDVEDLAQEIAGPAADPQILDLARHVAEAQIELGRVRQARHQLLTENMQERDEPGGDITTPEGLEEFATILAQENRQLVAMNRYERRALSRRKFAIRAFDDARSGEGDKMPALPPRIRSS